MNLNQGSFHIDHHTESSGVAITELIPPKANCKARLLKLVYTPGATVHDIVVMKPLEQVLTTAAAAAAATALVLNVASFTGQNLASGDYVAVEHSDGTYGLYLVSALATLTITINALTKAVNAGAKVYIFGSPTETYHYTYKTVASTRTEIGVDEAGIGVTGFISDGTYSRTGLGDPLMVYSANGTNAGTLNYGAGVYCRT